MWINNSCFKVKIDEGMHPYSIEYRDFWKDFKKFTIEGMWSGGKWMPPGLFFYTNAGTILGNRTAYSKQKSPMRPELWDVFWDLSYDWVEARGLTGFSGQPEVAALKVYLDAIALDPEKYDPEEEARLRAAVPNIRDLLRNTTVDLGVPLYLNEAKDYMLMGNRGFGKSYFVAIAIILHEFLTDGAKQYTDEIILSPPSTEVLVTAGESKYSSDLIKKVKLSYDNLPGGRMVGDIYIPCPLYKQTTGSWGVGSELVHSYKKKVGGTWQTRGTASKIKHRTFKDNDFAAQGTRPAVMVMEEIGMFSNLKAAQESSVDVMKNGTYKFGSCMYLGTGGDMDGGTIDASEMFYAPETYNMLSFEDTWEHKGKIAKFVPAYMGYAQFKDSEGRTNVEKAKKYLDDSIEAIRKKKNSSAALDSHIQYNPRVPSDMFLTKTGNIFPKKELQDWLGILEGNKKYEDSEFVCRLNYDNETGKVTPVLDDSLVPIRKFPLDMNKDEYSGAITIWENPYTLPNGEVPYGLYIAGTDPYDHDESGTQSLGSTFIYKRFYSLDQWHEIPVAEYTGRPKANEYYETLRRLLIYYNARCLYENEKKGLHQYFDHRDCTYLLMDQPNYIKDIVPNSTVNRLKGMHMPDQLKTHGETLIKNWLEEEYAPGKLNITKIRSIPLLKELIAYNRKGNFDRVMAFMLTMYGLQEVSKIAVDKKGSKDHPVFSQDFFSRQLYTHRTSNTRQTMSGFLNNRLPS